MEFPTSTGTTTSSRSLLYLQRDGTAARKPVRVWSGPEAIAQYLATDNFDDEVQGRLIQSLKSYLAVRTFNGTEIFGRHYRVEDLVAKMLTDLRVRASAALGFSVTHAVAGRPVEFVNAQTPEDNHFAESRLQAAFLQAGFTAVQFVMEPVAAAQSYASAAKPDDVVLVGDFGGGTTDFSLLRIGGAGEPHRVLANTGVGIAGDAFDARIVRYLVSPALGSNSLGRSLDKLLPALPAWVYAHLERWHTLSFLRTRPVMELLRTAEQRALEPKKIAALRTVVEHDLGYRLHGAVQRVKVALSHEKEAEFALDEDLIHLHVPVMRVQFEGWIAPELQRIQTSLQKVLEAAALETDGVDHVFLTGGTSLVPAVRSVFTRSFGESRVHSGEAFTSVAQGLAQIASRSTPSPSV